MSEAERAAKPGELILRLFVPGRPRTKGHMQPTHRRGVNGAPCSFGNAKDRPLTKAWMNKLVRDIRAAAGIQVQSVGGGKGRRIDGGKAIAEPVEVYTFFRFERTQSEAEKAEDGEVWPSHDLPWPTAISIGDEDTLRRAVPDALVKAGVLADDRWVIGGMNYKRWCKPGEAAGVLIVVVHASEIESVCVLESVSEDIV